MFNKRSLGTLIIEIIVKIPAFGVSNLISLLLFIINFYEIPKRIRDFNAMKQGEEKDKKKSRLTKLTTFFYIMAIILNSYVWLTLPVKGFLSATFGAVGKSLKYQIYLNIGYALIKSLIFYV